MINMICWMITKLGKFFVRKCPCRCFHYISPHVKKKENLLSLHGAVPFTSMLEATDDNRWAWAVIGMCTNGADDRSYKHLHPGLKARVSQENIYIRKTSTRNSASVGTSPDHPPLFLLRPPNNLKVIHIYQMNSNELFCYLTHPSAWSTDVLVWSTFLATDSPVLDFWWHLLWVSKPG